MKIEKQKKKENTEINDLNSFFLNILSLQIGCSFHRIFVELI